MKKFSGVGLKSLVAISLFTMVFIICSKAVVNKYNLPYIQRPINAI